MSMIRPLHLVAIALFCFLAVTAISAPLYAAQKGTSQLRDNSLRRGETRPTLDPIQFSNPVVRQAYQAAREIPWVLDSIYCYCYCEESPARHKSLLSCYVDEHASV